MKYICFDDGAIRELVSGRELQSVDFEDGLRFIDLLRSGKELEFFKKMGDAVVTVDKDGMYFQTPGHLSDKKFLIIDCEKSGLFSNSNENKRENLISVQKVFRFCIKYWGGSSSFTNSEKFIAGTSKTIIFPLPYSSGGGFRVVIEREPDSERLAKRSMSGKFLLLYKSGVDGADSSKEVASLSNFRKSVDSIQEKYKTLTGKIRVLSTVSVPTLQINNYHSNTNSEKIDLFSLGGMDECMARLTVSQKKFIRSSVQSVQRLFGPAGSGKTLSLILRTMNILKDAEDAGERMNAVFVTHSEELNKTVRSFISGIDQYRFMDRNPKEHKVCLRVSTVVNLCGDVLNQVISDTEFVDKDAEMSKFTQYMYIEEAFNAIKNSDLKAYLPHMSENFRKFVCNSELSTVIEAIQHEISVQIKGRANEKYDVYLKCPALHYGVPAESEVDKSFIFGIFNRYQEKLREINQFDTDDIVLSAIGQLDTPIWRRRRAREGYDFIAVDEVHHFNINELHLFHHFSRNSGSYPISFTIDQAQAVGDRGWADGLTEASPDGEGESTQLSTVFRSSREIVEFSESILASGASIFTNFCNSLDKSQSGFTVSEERYAQPVYYREFYDDNEMIEAAFSHAHHLMKETDSKPWEVLITSLSNELCQMVRSSAENRNKPISYINRRGDSQKIKLAMKSGHMVCGHADYIGGLEFRVVIVIGVDKGRVPYEGSSEDYSTRNYAKYVAHNRLYVAASRARYALEVFGLRSKGPSELLDHALRKGLLYLTT